MPKKSRKVLIGTDREMFDMTQEFKMEIFLDVSILY